LRPGYVDTAVSTTVYPDEGEGRARTDVIGEDKGHDQITLGIKVYIGGDPLARSAPGQHWREELSRGERENSFPFAATCGHLTLNSRPSGVLV